MSTAIARPQRPVSRADFPLAIICALSLEADAIEALFDDHWDCHIYSKAPGDPNSYSTGRIGHHNVVLAYMPEAGKANGAAVATNCRVSFPYVKLAIVVGICGVIPFTPGPRDAHHEIILGDVIVSQSVVQYDLGRQYPDAFEYKDTNEEALGRPNIEIRSLLSKLKGLRARRALETDMRKFLSLLQEDLELSAHYLEPGTDRLYEATYRHVDKDMPCDKCRCDGNLVPRERLGQRVPEPRVHFGRIASGDTVMKSGENRDDIARKLGIIAFEMESAGFWDSLPCLVIKGACDYADSHKAKATQNYAAATAAACTKAVLRHWVIPASHDPTGEGILPQSNINSTILVPFPPNEDFVGRQIILDDLRQRLSPEKSYAVAALYGLGGVGKTQIALAYVHELHVRSPDLSVFWVYASNKERMRQSYTTIMQQLKVPCGEDNSDVLELVKQWLEAEHHKPWLMVVDNVDELELFCGTAGLSRYLPACAQGKLLITTRNRQVAIRATRGRDFIEVPRMNDSEAQDLVGAHLVCLERDVADLSTLALNLEYLPLILVQAATFIQENGISVKEYLALLKNDENMVELLNEDFETSGRDQDSLRAVAKTWAISFRQIQRQNKLAGDLLAFISMFNHQHIPESFWGAYSSPTHSQKKPLELIKAIGVLKAFSVVSTGQNNSVSMHRLIQIVMRRWLIQEGIVESFVQCAMMVMNSKFRWILDEDRWMKNDHSIIHMFSIASVYADVMVAKLLRWTNTSDLFELSILMLLHNRVLSVAKSSFEEKELMLVQVAERNASLCMPDCMRKLSSNNHVLNEYMTVLANRLKVAINRWKLLHPFTVDVPSEVLRRSETDAQACSSGRSG